MKKSSKIISMFAVTVSMATAFGCMPTMQMEGSKASSMYNNSASDGFIYPESANPVMTEFIQRHKADYTKEYKQMFAMPAPVGLNTCGLTADDLQAWSDGGKDFKKAMKKASRDISRTTGMDMSSEMLFSNFEFLSVTCPSATANGKITYRYTTNSKTVMKEQNMVSEIEIRNIRIADLGTDKKPAGIITGVTTTKSKMTKDGQPLNIPSADTLGLNYSTADGKTNVSFSSMKIPYAGMSYMTMLTENLGNNHSRLDTWTNDVHGSTTYMKGSKQHGPQIVYGQKMKMGGLAGMMMPSDALNVPEQRKCFREGEEIKTAGECRWDD